MRTSPGLGAAVHNDLANVGEETRRPIALARPAEQLRTLVDEPRCVLAAGKAGMRDHLVQEPQVRRHAPDAKLPQCAVHARDGLLRGGRPRRHLHQQRVVGARNDRPRIAGPGIQANTEAGGAAVGGDLAVVGNKITLGVLRRDAALQRMGSDSDLALWRHAAFCRTDAGAGRDPDLRLHQIDAGRAFSHRMLDLDTGIDLDEVEPPGLCVLQKLHGAGVDVLRRAADRECRLAQFRPLCIVEEYRGRTLNDFLVATLHRAVALIQMHELAVGVAEYLHLHVPCLPHELLEIHLIVTEGGLGFSTRKRQQLRELRVALDDTHTSPAASPARLQHHWITNTGGEAHALGKFLRQRRRRWHDRHSRLNGEIACGDLVAQRPHGLGPRSDECESRSGTTQRELRILGQEPVAGMNCIDTRLTRDAQDVLDVQIGFNGPFVAPDQIGLVGLGPVQREAVFLRIDRYRAHAQLARGTHDANGDLAAVGDQQAAYRVTQFCRAPASKIERRVPEMVGEAWGIQSRKQLRQLDDGARSERRRR